MEGQTIPGPVEDRQDGPHAHQARYYEKGCCLYVPDLGLDCVVQYDVSVEDETLTEKFGTEK